MILKKYDFESVHEFLTELIREINNKGEVHLTTVLMGKSKGTISVVGNDQEAMIASLNYALKSLITRDINAGNKPDMDAVATIIKHDVQREYLSKETIKESKDSIDKDLQELLDIFRTKH